MQTQKMSLANIKGKLSRDEMKKIMAGSGGGNKCNVACTSNANCDSTCGSCEVNTNWNNQKFCV